MKKTLLAFGPVVTTLMLAACVQQNTSQSNETQESQVVVVEPTEPNIVAPSTAIALNNSDITTQVILNAANIQSNNGEFVMPLELIGSNADDQIDTITLSLVLPESIQIKNVLPIGHTMTIENKETNTPTIHISSLLDGQEISPIAITANPLAMLSFDGEAAGQIGVARSIFSTKW